MTLLRRGRLRPARVSRRPSVRATGRTVRRGRHRRRSRRRVLLMYVMRSRERTRFVQIESDRARQNAFSPRTRWREVAGPMSDAKLVQDHRGLDQDACMPKERELYPYRFEFRLGCTATSLRAIIEGKIRFTRESAVEVLSDNIGTSHSSSMSRWDYLSSITALRFTFRSDGTFCSSTTAMDGLVFTREK